MAAHEFLILLKRTQKSAQKFCHPCLIFLLKRNEMKATIFFREILVSMPRVMLKKFMNMGDYLYAWKNRLYNSNLRS